MVGICLLCGSGKFKSLLNTFPAFVMFIASWNYLKQLARLVVKYESVCFTTDEREDLRSVPDVDIAKLVQSVENKRNNLSEVDLRPNTFKKIDNEGIFNPGNFSFYIINTHTFIHISRLYA